VLCEGEIAKGETHIVRCGIDDGCPERFRMHTRCEKVTQEWDEYAWELKWTPSEFRKEMEEFYRDRD
jgi:hypothetical protein